MSKYKRRMKIGGKKVGGKPHVIKPSVDEIQDVGEKSESERVELYNSPEFRIFMPQGGFGAAAQEAGESVRRLSDAMRTAMRDETMRLMIADPAPESMRSRLLQTYGRPRHRDPEFGETYAGVRFLADNGTREDDE